MPACSGSPSADITVAPFETTLLTISRIASGPSAIDLMQSWMNSSLSNMITFLSSQTSLAGISAHARQAMLMADIGVEAHLVYGSAAPVWLHLEYQRARAAGAP